MERDDKQDTYGIERMVRIGWISTVSPREPLDPVPATTFGPRSALPCRRISNRGRGDMVGVTERRAGRQWADVVAIVTAVTLVGLSLWPNIAAHSTDGVQETGNPSALVPLRIAAAALTLGGVFAAQRWARRPLARALLLAAALLLVAGLVLFRGVGFWGIATLVVPAVALVAASTAIGPLPGTESGADG
jgi:hypothetical protein